MSRAASFIAAVLPLMTGRKVFMGFVAMQGGAQQPIIGKADTIAHCEAFLCRGQPLMYVGSDSQWQHFISRPIDDTAFYQISRYALKLEDEQSYDPNHKVSRIALSTSETASKS